MPAYMIALARVVHDRQKLETYWNAVAPTFEGLGVKRLAVYTPFAPMELVAPLEGAVVLEFPDMATATAWYESPGYQAAKQHSSLSMAAGSQPKIDCRNSRSGSLESLC
jgi:uncharacterized protein (DUF1330 family)